MTRKVIQSTRSSFLHVRGGAGHGTSENPGGFRKISHSLNFFSILLQWEKRVGGTLSDFHRTEGEKECSPLFLPICKVGKKSGGYTVFPHL